jgi:hypothetical protein
MPTTTHFLKSLTDGVSTTYCGGQYNIQHTYTPTDDWAGIRGTYQPSWLASKTAAGSANAQLVAELTRTYYHDPEELTPDEYAYVIYRTFLMFDVSAIPVGATIVSASIKGTLKRFNTQGDGGCFHLWGTGHRTYPSYSSEIDDIFDPSAEWGNIGDHIGTMTQPADDEPFSMSLSPTPIGQAVSQGEAVALVMFGYNDAHNTYDTPSDSDMLTVSGLSIEITYTYIPTVTFPTSGPNAYKLMGADSSMVYRLRGAGGWTAISGADPDLSSIIGAIYAAGGIEVAYDDNPNKEVEKQTIVVLRPILDMVSWAWTGIHAYLLWGSTGDMEYSLNGSSWTTCSSNMSLEDFLDTFTPTGNIGVRYIAFPDEAVSFPMAPDDVTFSFDGANGMKLMSTDDTMEYSLDGGTTYTTCSTNTDLTAYLNTTDWSNNIRIRYIGAIVPYVITLNAAPAPPVITFTFE